MKELKGAAVSAGIAIGKAYLFVGEETPDIPRFSIKKQQVEDEWQRFLQAAKSVSGVMQAQFQRDQTKSNKEQAAIIKAHIMMLEDVDFHEQLKAQLEKELQNIEWTLWSLSRKMTAKLLAAADAYLRERAVDIADVSRQLLFKLLDVKQQSLAELTEDVIVVSHDLLPSQTFGMNRTHVKALIMDAGSETSHTAIIARSFEIPAVLGLSDCTKLINSGDIIIVDGNSGKVFLHPNEETLEKYKSELVAFEKNFLEGFTQIDLPSETLDGTRFCFRANIELPPETGKALKFGAEGIGLFRSEFLFLSSGQSAEEEKQYIAYKQAIKLANGFPVKIRTCDLGGDKVNPDYFQNTEKNPLLGWRAIRFSLSMKELFKAQLRAILRAAAHGKAEIIFPLISCVEEFDEALLLLEEAKNECKKLGLAIDSKIKTGVMLEVPSAVLSADVLAKKADFFSIGTNDLVQYTLAADGGNEKVNYLTRGIQPAVLKLIKMSIDAAHNAGIPVAMCGEMAGKSRWTALLAGLGLDEFSMSASTIPEVKRVLRSVKLEDCKELARASLLCSRSSEIDTLLDEFHARFNIKTMN
jgi:phosphotransferase system enzyme I (PtsI)